jgi:hypothetical protein
MTSRDEQRTALTNAVHAEPSPHSTAGPPQ